jgi:hypothetical protein
MMTALQWLKGSLQRLLCGVHNKAAFIVNKGV